MLLAIAVGVIAVTGLSGRLGVSAPLLLMVVGMVVSLLPFTDLHLDPELVLIGLLPPLLYATAIKTSVIDFRSQLGAIGYLSIGLVLVTALAVGLVAWAIVPALGFAAAFALGAVVAPPDAVAATAVGKRIGLPRRLVSLLEGESLVNDATAITCLRMASVAIVGGAAVGGAAPQTSGGSVGALEVAETFALALFGGIAIGVVAAFVIARVRRHVTNPITDTAISFVAPFIAYLPAEGVHSSGVIAVVTTGLILGHRAPVIQTAQSRLSERINWSTIQFLLENAVFLVIGLQFNWIIGDVFGGGIGPWTVVAFCAAVLGAVIVVRMIWTVAGMTLLLHRGRAGRAKLRISIIGGWAGMRGVVTLAAALLLPEQTPHRELLLLAAMVVTAGTLLLHGLTLGPLARRLGVAGPDAREDALAMAAVLERVGTRAMTRLEGEQGAHNHVAMQMVRDRAATRTNAIWERLGRSSDHTAPSEEYRALRLESLGFEREEVLKLRSDGGTDQEILTRVLSVLDVEESMLAGIESSLDPIEDNPLTGPQNIQAHLCEELAAAGDASPTSHECLDCVREGTLPVHLRMCLTCGEVGCCDSSTGLHATRHFHDTGHPVMRSVEPGESWRWCYVHELIG